MNQRLHNNEIVERQLKMTAAQKRPNMINCQINLPHTRSMWEIYLKNNYNNRSPRCGSEVMNMISVHEDAGVVSEL